MDGAGTWVRVLAAIIAVAGVVIVATSGDSLSVRFLTLIVTGDISVRLLRHAAREPTDRRWLTRSEGHRRALANEHRPRLRASADNGAEAARHRRGVPSRLQPADRGP